MRLLNALARLRGAVAAFAMVLSVGVGCVSEADEQSVGAALDDGGVTDGGGDYCNDETCPRGCCDSWGTCHDGTDYGYCGNGGALCVSCSTMRGTTCLNHACQACNPT